MGIKEKWKLRGIDRVILRLHVDSGPGVRKLNVDKDLGTNPDP